MSQKRGIAVALVLVALLTLAAAGVSGCSDDSKDSDGSGSSGANPLLKVGLTGTVSTLDLTTANEGVPVSSLGLEQLLQLSPDGELEPWLAESVDQPSPDTYVYHLRRGVKFWNGNELTSADVVNSLNHARKGPISAPKYTSVKSIKARDPYTVVVKLKQPDASWKFVPAQYYAQIFEKKHQDKHGDALGKPDSLMMGTGPYKFDSLDPTRGAKLSANPTYWGGDVPYDQIAVQFFSTDNSRALAFRSGEIDVAPGINQPQEFATTSGAKPVTSPSCAAGNFSMNTAVEPWNDVHVRRAVAYALNRDDIVAAWGGYAKPNYSMIPANQLQLLGSEEQVSTLIDSLPHYDHDTDKARAEMAASAYPDGFTMPLPSLRGYGQDHSKVNQVIAKQLGEIGIKTDIKQIGEGAFIEAIGPPAAKRSTLFLWDSCVSRDPGYYTSQLGSENSKSGYNSASYGPAAVDQLMADAAVEQNPDERLKTYGKLLERVATDVPYVPLFVSDAAVAISEDYTWPGYGSDFFNRSWGLDVVPK